MPSPAGAAVDVAMQPFAQYASLPAQAQNQSQGQSQSQSQPQGLGAAQSMADLRALARGHGQQHPFLQGQGLVLSHFIVDQGPWNPLGMDPSCGGDLSKGQPGPAQFTRQFPNFGIDYRNPVPALSEADTVSPSVTGLLSDSGYGSMAAKQSVGNPSIYNGDADHSFDTRSLASHFQRMTHRTALPNEEHRKRELVAQRPASGAPKVLVCPDCKATLKTNSELNKHRARHNKPFKCTVAECPKATEGFSTNNDLDRHKRCVHKLVVGPETFYRCDIDQCREKLKNWPRQDNFKQHLSRKHGVTNVDLARFTFQTRDPADSAGFVPSAAITSTEPAMMSSDPHSHSAWTAVNHTHVSPASLMNVNGDVGHHGLPNMMAYENHSASFNVGSSRYMTQDSLAHNRVQLDMEPALSGLSIPPPSQRAGTPISELLSFVDQSDCVAPDMLRQTGTETRTLMLADIGLPPVGDARWWGVRAGVRPLDHEAVTKEEAPLEIDDASEDSAGLEEDGVQSERDEVESSAPDGMDVDDAVQDSVSQVDPQDSDSEHGDPADDTPDTDPIVEVAATQVSQEPEAQVKASPPEPQPSAETPVPIDVDDDLRTEAFLRSLIEGGKLRDKLKKLGFPMPDEAEPKEQKPPVESSAASDSDRFDNTPVNDTPVDTGPVGNGRANNNDNKTINKCDECPKTFIRRCELKKHQKRHAKPYHCTYADCDKKFGSKNDWKRHENSQHFQLEIWRCAERADGQPECGKVCHRRESLHLHLRKDHGILDPGVLDQKLADCRIGRNFGSRFWCGFCQKTIEPSDRAAPAHAERFDHIDAHFNGKDMLKADIKDWKHVDTDLSELPDLALMVKAKGANSRKRGHDGDTSEAKAKRRRAENGAEEYWTCCFCKQYWRVDSKKDPAPMCLDECIHKRCDECVVFKPSQQDELNLPALAAIAQAAVEQEQGKDGPAVGEGVEGRAQAQERVQ
ncbi:hypothetical protein C8A05DRAFT_29977 [Staphylotrichum tortipilum]|uniref:C2H2-type domain-containing protein n=1 Tax=Staphylotrichum tortipilum TaxID=2831512 RepID=A0AAN6MTK0_9PEZI|nr:hypothetical protein C8A05DRAFT_29977 [Staphylotrichum longicolle]